MPSSRPLLELTNLSVSIQGKEIVRDVSLTVRSGELHALMGPNGAGKSTLVHALMGHPACAVASGTIQFRGKNLAALAPHERARAGLFLAFQHPREIAGVTVRNFLYAASHTLSREKSPFEFEDRLAAALRALTLPPAFADRPVHRGLSGGERKKLELLQLLVLRPVLALFDEIDSGLDLDALRQVGIVLRSLRRSTPSFAAILVSHSPRLLHSLKPDHVHIMIHGEIRESGGAVLIRRLEREGFRRYRSSSSSSPVRSQVQALSSHPHPPHC